MWHQLSGAETADRLNSSVAAGLTSDEAEHRLATVGANALVDSGGRGIAEILFEQWRSSLVALLLVAAVVSCFLGEYLDAIAILVIVVLNAALGFFQDYRAEQALAKLARFDVPSASVLRNGSWKTINSEQLVPGDVVRLQAGNLVPADCRLLEVTNLQAQEATLTGESEPVDKQVAALSTGATALADRLNMVFKGTQLTYGHAIAMVVATGASTELGTIAESLLSVRHEPTPLQVRLGRLGRTLAVAAVVIVATVYLLGIAAGETPRMMLMTSLSLAVAIVPEGLPAVATLTLAIGAMQMFRRRALIRRLPAVETLGSVTVICTDKTGTLTENRMHVTNVVLSGKQLAVANDDCQLEGGDTQSGPLADSGGELFLTAITLCNNATLADAVDTRRPGATGQPTEVALLALADRFGYSQPELRAKFPRIAEIPFDSSRKRMTTVHHGIPRWEVAPNGEKSVDDVQATAFVKGAGDSLLDVCSFELQDGQTVRLDHERVEILRALQDDLAQSGMRILGVAFLQLSEISPAPSADEVEHDLTFIGFACLSDPPRRDVREAMQRCSTAGIRTIMITGDHPLTAQSIALATGTSDNTATITGPEMAQLDDGELDARIADTDLFARVAPVDKLRIVRALQSRGDVVAMTGDGVNDAPALKKAHIGIAMGINGADVSKEASDMVLLDDHFATIVNAVEQGRVVYDNIRKFVRYTMTSNAGEICVMVVAPLLSMPLPLLPLQILWINLVTDGLPGLALAVEPPEQSVMRRRPTPPRQPIIDRQMWIDILWIGLTMGLVSVAAGYWYWIEPSHDPAYWRTVIFTVLTLSQMGNVLAIRSDEESLFRIGLLSNRPLLAAILLTFALHLAAIYAGPLQAVFKTVSLGFGDLAACIALSSVVFVAVELKKFLRRRASAKRSDEQAAATAAA